MIVQERDVHFNVNNVLIAHWNRMFLGIYVFEMGNMFYEFIFRDNYLCRLMSLVGICILMYSFICVPKRLPFSKNPGICIIAILYICVSLITIFRGALQSKIGDLIISPQYFWQYVLPFAVFLKIPKNYFEILYKWCFIYVITALCFCIYNFQDFYIDVTAIVNSMIGWESYVLNRPQIPCQFAMPMCIYLFSWKNISNVGKMIIVVTFILALCAALFAGRRSVAASLLFFILISIIIYLRGKKMKFLFLMLLFLSLFTFKMDYLLETLEDTFVVLFDRIDADTRSGVEDDFFRDFKGVEEWLFGRGMDGTYRSPSVAELDTMNRRGIETGYLNIILHGGLFLLFPYIILLLYSVINNVARRKDSYFSLSVIVYIIFHFVWLYPSGTPKLNLEYFVLWNFIAISYLTPDYFNNDC